MPTHHKTTEAPRQPDFRQKFSATIDQNRHRISMDLLLHALRLFDGMLFKMPNPNLGKLWLLWCKADGFQITYRYNALHTHYDDKWGTILYNSCTNNQCQDETCIMNEMTFPISTSWLQLCDTILTRGEFFVGYITPRSHSGQNKIYLRWIDACIIFKLPMCWMNSATNLCKNEYNSSSRKNRDTSVSVTSCCRSLRVWDVGPGNVE